MDPGKVVWLPDGSLSIEQEDAACESAYGTFSYSCGDVPDYQGGTLIYCCGG